MTLFHRPSVGLRLSICAAFGVVLFSALPSGWEPGVRSALAWILAAGAFLGWTVSAVSGAPPDRLRAIARQQDAERWVISGLIILAAGASLIAVAGLLHKQEAESPVYLAGRIALVAGVLTTSWLLIHAVFAIHYTHSYYGDGPEAGPEDRGGVEFPGNSPDPDFWDFLYFSLVIGMTCQVSDVQITGKHIRRLATAHGVLSFVFNTVILALTVNLVVNSL